MDCTRRLVLFAVLAALAASAHARKPSSDLEHLCSALGVDVGEIPSFAQYNLKEGKHGGVDVPRTYRPLFVGEANVVTRGGTSLCSRCYEQAGVRLGPKLRGSDRVTQAPACGTHE